jgi:cation transport ATPase
MRLLPPAESLQDGACACGGHHSHVQGPLVWIAVGSLFVVNSFLLGWLFPEDQRVLAASALIGALILGGPIIWIAFNDLRVGALKPSALVALAVLALVATGHHQEAGVVSFFMLLGALKLINPVVADLFHVSGSLLVVFNSFRLVRQGEELEPHSILPTGATTSKLATSDSVAPLAKANSIPTPS